MLHEPESVTKYIGHHDHVKKDLNIVTTGLPALSTELLAWCHSLSMFERNWRSLKSKCSDLVQEAKTMDETDQLATYVLFNLLKKKKLVTQFRINSAPRLSRKVDTAHFVEDSANSSLESNPQLKPDWTLYVKPWHTKIDLATCEVKPPGKPGSSDLSDFVKLGVELRTMLNALIGVGIEDANWKD
ncbi:hypothetical protein DFQ28_000770 [Apophysomyces sp. BC1034]|nr:hypothetical protein DFQ28_000770 [Apophysomyces sp. BC1034]